jgi:molecular chaperone GrpE (heat shock protein)
LQSAAGGGQRLGAVQSGNLSSKVEELRAQVAEERAARQAVQQKLTDLRKEVERNEKKIKEVRAQSTGLLMPLSGQLL